MSIEKNIHIQPDYTPQYTQYDPVSRLGKITVERKFSEDFVQKGFTIKQYGKNFPFTCGNNISLYKITFYLKIIYDAIILSYN